MFKNSKLFLVTLGTLTLVVLGSFVSMAMGTEPGTSDDPVVTKSYVEMRNEQLKFYIDEQVKNFAKNINDKENDNDNALNNHQGNIQTPIFEILELQKGQKVIGGASAEMILRSGKAQAIGSESGGVVDLISGEDLVTGDDITKNHLLLLPRGDGRGMKILQNKTYILIKGSYTIQ